jgi:hypothetical protein
MILLKVVVCKKPKGYMDTKMRFPKHEIANKYVNDLDAMFEMKRLEALEIPLSIRNKKRVKFIRPKKYLLTKEGNQFKLWRELK